MTGAPSAIGEQLKMTGAPSAIDERDDERTGYPVPMPTGGMWEGLCQRADLQGWANAYWQAPKNTSLC